MTTQNKKRDDELKVWIIVGAIFTIFLLIIDFFYSSVNSMAFAARMVIWIGHAALSLGWIVSIAKVADPAYDDVRKGVVYLCIVLSLVIGIHHALAVEGKQVIEDSEKNKTTWMMGHTPVFVHGKMRIYEVGKEGAARQTINSSSFLFGNCEYFWGKSDDNERIIERLYSIPTTKKKKRKLLKFTYGINDVAACKMKPIFADTLSHRWIDLGPCWGCDAVYDTARFKLTPYSGVAIDTTNSIFLAL